MPVHPISPNAFCSQSSIRGSSHLRPILLLTASAALFASDSDYNNSLRLSLTSLPDKLESEVTAYNTVSGAQLTTKAEGKWKDSAGRLSASVFHNTGGQVALNIGVGLALSAFEDSASGGTATLSEFGVVVEPGISFNFHKNFSLELGVPLGAGAAAYKEDDGAGVSIETQGTYLEYGIVARPILRLEKFLAFIEFGWLSNTASVDRAKFVGIPNVEAEATMTTSGTFVSLGLGVAF